MERIIAYVTDILDTLKRHKVDPFHDDTYLPILFDIVDDAINNQAHGECMCPACTPREL
jgi:hypothetical protein